MADAKVLSNQKTILSNQSTIVKNQKAILSNQIAIVKNQKTILANQGAIKKNQSALDEILKNQKLILAAVTSSAFPSPDHSREGPGPARPGGTPVPCLGRLASRWHRASPYPSAIAGCPFRLTCPPLRHTMCPARARW